MISLVDLEKSFGGRTLFEDVSLQLNAGSRYGLVGANGSGKTTLLKVLLGDEEPSRGKVTFQKNARIGTLRQDRFLDDDQAILDVAMQGDHEAWQALQGTDDDELRRTEAHTLAARAGAVLEGLGIKTAVHKEPLRTLSGGFKLRVLLAQALIARPDVLLLDEPTNHLDILSIRWLEKFLSSFAGCAVVISHDQRFLENTVTHILDVDYGTITLYPGGYRKFVVEKEARREQKEAEIENKLAAIEHKRAFVERFGAKNTKARQAQSRLKQIEKIEDELEDLPPSSRRAPRFAFSAGKKSGKDVLEVKNVSKAYGPRVVLNGVSLLVRQGEKVAVIGPNGVGKSTLLKIIASASPAPGLAPGLAPDDGSVRIGHEVQLGYFAQDHKELLHEDDTPLAFLTRVAKDEGQAFVRGHLGRVLFSKDDVEKRVAALSGGEAARLVLAKLAVERPNLMLLDEPTNHLDLEAIQALVTALQGYDGTLLFVSHDRYVVQELATRIVEITPTGMRDFAGTYAEYLAASGDDHLDSAKSVVRTAAPSQSASAVSWEEQKRQKNLKQQLEKRRDKLLLEIEALEKKKAELHALFSEPSFYEKSSADEVKRVHDDEAATSAQLDALVAEWESVEQQLAE